MTVHKLFGLDFFSLFRSITTWEGGSMIGDNRHDDFAIPLEGLVEG